MKRLYLSLRRTQVDDITKVLQIYIIIAPNFPFTDKFTFVQYTKLFCNFLFSFNNKSCSSMGGRSAPRQHPEKPEFLQKYLLKPFSIV